MKHGQESELQCLTTSQTVDAGRRRGRACYGRGREPVIVWNQIWTYFSYDAETIAVVETAILEGYTRFVDLPELACG